MFNGKYGIRITDNGLDDNCAADALGSELLKRYYEKYREIATRIGVSLAEEENKSKAFGPSTEGEVLGLNYDTLRWKCWIPHEKSDSVSGETFLKLTKVLGDSLYLVFTWRSMNFTCCCFEGILMNVTLVWILLSFGPRLAPFSPGQRIGD